MADDVPTPSGFAPVPHAQWRAELEEQLGATGFERKLVTKTHEGLRIEPLHEDSPGRYPELPRGQSLGWRAEVDIDASGPLDDVRDGLRRDLAHGVRGLRFKRLRPFDLDYLLDGVSLAEVALHFEGGDPIEYGQALLRVVQETKTSAKTLHGGFGARGNGASVDFARWVRVEFREMAAARITTVTERDAGAGEALQLGLALAEGLAKLEAWTAAGFELGLCSRALEFEFAIGTDVFLEIAKLRAARLTWARLVAALGGDAEAQTLRLAVRTSERAWTARNPWGNLLRGTSMTFAAATGGADSFTLLPYDTCLGESDAEARRLAANTQAILAAESQLGRVQDPGAGSGYLESLTEALARAGWERLQEIQRAGGIDAARASGWVERAVSETAELEERAVRSRGHGIVGVSEFPSLDERLPQRPPGKERSAARRLAAPFEALRDRSDAHLARLGGRPQAFLANLGPIPEHRARAAFAENLLAAGGIETITNDGFGEAAAASAAFADSGARLCVIASTDERYVEEVPSLARELTGKGAVVVVAGRPGEHEAAWREAGVQHFIHLGCDAPAVLEQLLEQVGVDA